MTRDEIDRTIRAIFKDHDMQDPRDRRVALKVALTAAASIDDEATRDLFADRIVALTRSTHAYRTV